MARYMVYERNTETGWEQYLKEFDNKADAFAFIYRCYRDDKELFRNLGDKFYFYKVR